MLGAPSQEKQSDVLFNPMVDYIVRLAPCSAKVVQGGHEASPEPPRRILVPTNGTQAARRAAQIAFARATPGTVVLILNVVVVASDERGVPAALRTFRRNNLRAGQLVQATVDIGTRTGIAASGKVLRGRDPAATILAFAADAGCDLIVIGTDLRPGADRLFLGPGVERLLQGAAILVLLANMA